MERRGATRKEREGETLDGIQEVVVGEDRQAMQRTPIARFSVTDAKVRETCPTYDLTRRLLEHAPATKLFASNVATRVISKGNARR